MNYYNPCRRLEGKENVIYAIKCGKKYECKRPPIVPIRKHWKDTREPTNYRAIALTFHICTLMERMVKREANVYYWKTRYEKVELGEEGVLIQCKWNKEAQINKETVVAIYFDVEKACNILWREQLMIKL